MTQNSSTMETIKSFILNVFLVGEDPSTLTPTTPLMSAGILDSISTLKLTLFLEKEFNITVQAHETDEEHLDTLESICKLVESKR